MKKIIYSVFLIAILFTVTKVFAQDPPYIIWNKTFSYGASTQNSVIALSANTGGALFATGWFMNGTNADIVTIRYNIQNGDTMWVKVFSTNLEDKPAAIISDNNFVYITGWSFSPTPLGRDVVTIKYNAVTGDTVFVKKYNGTGNGGDYGRAITLDGSGNVYVTGRSDVGNAQKYTTLKYDASGNLVWTSVYTGPLSTNFDESLAIKVDASGNAYVTGYCNGATSATSDILTLKINGTDGLVSWAKRYNGPLNFEDRGVGIAIDNAGANVIVGGYASRPALAQDFFAIKYNTAGDSVGAIYYSSSSNIEFANAMTKDQNDNIYLTGFTFLNNLYHYQTVRFNSSLTNVDWSKQTTENDSALATAICYEPSGYIYVTGNSAGTGSGRDYLTIRYDASNGTEKWRKRENGAANLNDLPASIVATGPDSVFLTGNSGTPAGTVFYTIRYAEIVSVKPISTQVPKNFSLEQNYPNPFNPVTNIRFSIPQSSFVKISVFDVLGKEIAVIVNENLKAGKYEADWNAAGVSSGVYFYKISAGDYTETRKMILNK